MDAQLSEEEAQGQGETERSSASVQEAQPAHPPPHQQQTAAEQHARIASLIQYLKLPLDGVDRSALDLAHMLSKAYVEDVSVLRLFLESEEHHITPASSSSPTQEQQEGTDSQIFFQKVVARIAKHFSNKVLLFGLHLLIQSVTLQDLSVKDQVSLSSGGMLLLPEKTLKDERCVLVIRYMKLSYDDPLQIIRSFWFLIMAAVNTGLLNRPIEWIIFGPEEPGSPLEDGNYSIDDKLQDMLVSLCQSLPLPLAHVHYCSASSSSSTFDSRDHLLETTASEMGLSVNYHRGSIEECIQALSAEPFGVPQDALSSVMSSKPLVRSVMDRIGAYVATSSGETPQNLKLKRVEGSTKLAGSLSKKIRSDAPSSTQITSDDVPGERSQSMLNQVSALPSTSAAAAAGAGQPMPGAMMTGALGNMASSGVPQQNTEDAAKLLPQHKAYPIHQPRLQQMPAIHTYPTANLNKDWAAADQTSPLSNESSAYPSLAGNISFPSLPSSTLPLAASPFSLPVAAQPRLNAASQLQLLQLLGSLQQQPTPTVPVPSLPEQQLVQEIVNANLIEQLLTGGANTTGAAQPFLQQSQQIPAAMAGTSSAAGLTAPAGTASTPTRNSGLRNVHESSAPRSPRTLYTPSDDSTLSAYQCLVRKQIEMFEATQDDVQYNISKMNKTIVAGQVGIRCKHCAVLPQYQRPKAAVYYPRTLDSLYQFGQNMVKNHLCGTCRQIPPHIKQELMQLQEERRRGSGGRERWAEAAGGLGVVEDSHGLRFAPRK